MRVFTPIEAAKNASESKYLGVLAAARYARELNALPKDAVPAGLEQKLTTINGALCALAGGLVASDSHLGRAARAFRL